ncbi:uncharacterized protein EAE97_007384 [Botrytis byssoidea]|uniref:Uncharacterized protein n=1 Tax=Botrytis byssoidea TaxID=139641 RepID=A0A9P5II20_9HELO|nr:uncharacterized protein EAE97_007384 [Botrytis byssoidea]KAF7939304.1 hypothetical protein EAE97_007384 [Botrytis byssoidea]
MSHEKSSPSTFHHTPGSFEPINPASEAGPSSSRQNHLDTLSDANSPHHNHDDDSTPPAYSAALSPPILLRSNPQLRSPGIPNLPYNLYLPPSFTLSSDKTTITSSSAHLSNPGTLLPLITSLCTIPPKPMLRIVGQRMHAPAPDFDIRINLMCLIVGEGERKMNYMKILGRGEMGWRGGVREATEPDFGGQGGKGLEGWVRAFCGDEAGVKEFILTRQIPNLSTTHLQGLILALIAQTGYPGHTTISFPITHSKVVVRPPDRVNSFFSSMAKVFMGTKRYEVVSSVWPFADVGRGIEGRRCVVMGEEEWFDEWKNVIGRAVVKGKKGWVTVEDRLEWLMEGQGNVEQWQWNGQGY